MVMNAVNGGYIKNYNSNSENNSNSTNSNVVNSAPPTPELQLNNIEL